jgi:dihydroxyacetone kinase-like predicted kinase
MDHNDAELERNKNKINPKQLGVIAISNGKGVNQLFNELNVDEIVFGGQSINPSVEDIQKAVDNLPNEEIIILPNNSNIILTANAVKDSSDRKITVLPTKSIQQGLVALYNLSKEMTPFEEYYDTVQNTFNETPEGSITYAVRDTEMDGVVIKEGEFIAISGKKIITSNKERIDTFKELLKDIVSNNPEEITLLHNDDVSKEEMEEIKKLLSDTGIDSEIYYGGQEVYSILMFGEL